jgi:hypothetical protein
LCRKCEEDKKEDDDWEKDCLNPPQVGTYKCRGMRSRFIDRDGVWFEIAQATLHFLLPIPQE